MRSIQTIFGSKSFLAQYVIKHPELILLQPSSHDQDYAIVDLTGQVPFTNPLQYTAESDLGTVKDRSFLQMMYFNLNSEDVPVFVAKVKTLFDQHEIFPGLQALMLLRANTKAIQYVLASAWDDGHQFFALKNTPAFQPLLELTRRAADSNGYHETGYKRIFPESK